MKSRNIENGREMKKFLTILLVASLASCSHMGPFKAYKGDVKNPDEIARVLGKIDGTHAVFERFNQNILITCVNGVSTEDFYSMSKHRFPSEIHVEEGNHYIGFIHTEHFPGESFKVEEYITGRIFMTAEKGHVYQIHTSSSDLKAWVTDENGEIVSSKGPKDSGLTKAQRCETPIKNRLYGK